MGLRGVLRQHAGGASTVKVVVEDPATVAAALDALGMLHPAVERRIRDEQGHLRRHVNIFVDGQELRRLGGTELRLSGGEEVLVLPAISGG